MVRAVRKLAAMDFHSVFLASHSQWKPNIRPLSSSPPSLFSFMKQTFERQNTHSYRVYAFFSELRRSRDLFSLSCTRCCLCENAYKRSRQPTSRRPSNGISKQICFDANNNNTINYEKHNKKALCVCVMWTRNARGPIRSFNISAVRCVWANGTCHMLIFSFPLKGIRLHSGIVGERRTAYFIDLLNSMRRLFIISIGGKGERAPITAAHWANHGWFTKQIVLNANESSLLICKRQIAIDWNTVAAGGADWRSCEHR